MAQDFTPTFEPSSFEIPVRRFKGRLAELKYEDIQKNDGSGTFKRATFSFTELQVLETTEPYTNPILHIQIIYATFPNTQWTVLGSSARKITGEYSPDPLKGKLQEWAVLPAKVNQRNQETNKYEVVDSESWQVVSIEGYATPAGDNGTSTQPITPDMIAKLAVGKTEAQFNDEAFKDPQIREDKKLRDQIMDREVLPALIAGGFLTRDEAGLYQAGPELEKVG